MKIQKLMIEVTRKCNMTCAHCLRGNAQNLSMKYDILNAFLSNVHHINRMGFTGGEPTLPDGLNAMRDFINICIQKNITVGDFWIITNGKVWRNEIGEIIRNMMSLCSENEDSLVEISQDQYHDNVPKKRKYFKNQLVKSVSDLSLMILHRESQLDTRRVISEGRAASNEIGSFDWTPSYIKYDAKNDSVRGENIYVNCLGNIISGCDLSYESQDMPEHIICSVYDNLKQKFIEKMEPA